MTKFSVDYRISGTMTEVIDAATEEEARKLVEDKAYADDWEPDLDSVDDVDFSIREMHRVSRDGNKIWTTYVRSTDTRLED